MTEQQTKDHELITNIWHMLRDFGDIQNNAPDGVTRWQTLNEYADELTKGKEDNGMTRFFVARTLQALEDRTCGREIGSASKRSKEDQELLDLFHRMQYEQKTALLVMARMIGGSR